MTVKPIRTVIRKKHFTHQKRIEEMAVEQSTVSYACQLPGRQRPTKPYKKFCLASQGHFCFKSSFVSALCQAASQISMADNETSKSQT
jgi:hypothetical protein